MQFSEKVLTKPYIYVMVGLLWCVIGFIIPTSGYYEFFKETKYINFDELLYIFFSCLFFVLGFSINLLIKNTSGGEINAKYYQKYIKNILNWSMRFSILINCIVIGYFFYLTGVSNYIQAAIQGAFIQRGILENYSRSVSGFSFLLSAMPGIYSLLLFVDAKYKRSIPKYVIICFIGLLYLRPFIRGDVGQIILCLFIFLISSIRRKNVGAVKGLISTLIFSLTAIVVFSVYQASRGQISSFYEIPRQFFGYFIGSYNRFGIQIQYDKPLDFSSGYNIISALNAIPGFSSLFNLNQIWYNQFNYIKPLENFSVWYGYGIDPQFNVITAFGYTFQDFGYAGPIFFVLYGLAVRLSYDSYRLKRLYGIISYPTILWSVFELRGKLEITYFNVQSVIILAFIISLCYRLILQRKR